MYTVHYILYMKYYTLITVYTRVVNYTSYIMHCRF